jgi:hypothetical protein
MTVVQQKLISAYTVLVLANKIDISSVKDSPVTLDDGSSSTIRHEVEITVAEKTVNALA